MKRVNFIFKLLIFLLLIASIGFIASCEKSNFKPKEFKFQGTCKIKKYNEDGKFIGLTIFNSTDTTDIEGIDLAINTCSLVGGEFILNNDSSGRMCYTCIGQKWFPN